MVSKSTLKYHPLGCVTSEATSDQNITRLHKLLINLNDVDDSLFKLRACELLDKVGVHFFLVVRRFVTEGREVLSRTITSDPHQGSCDRALQERERIGAVGEEAKAVLANI